MVDFNPNIAVNIKMHAAFLYFSATINLQQSIGVSDWIKFNLNQTGFYRVNYHPSIWRTFASVLNSGDISVCLSYRYNY